MVQGYNDRGHEPEFQRVARPPTVIGGGGAGAISTDMRSRARAEDEERMRAAAAAALEHRQARTAQLDLSAEAQFPGLGPNAAPAALMHRGWVGGAASRQVMNASFPTLGESTMSRGQKKKLKAKAKRTAGGDSTFGSTNDLPPAEVMAMGIQDAVSQGDTPLSGPSTPTSAEMAGPSRSAQAAPAAFGQPPGLGPGAGPSRAQQRPLQNAFERLEVDEPAPGRSPVQSPALGRSPARSPARPALPAAAQPAFPALGGAAAPARAGPTIGGWVSVRDKKAAPAPAARKPAALNSRSAFPALMGKPGGPSGKPQSLAAAGNELFKKMRVRPAGALASNLECSTCVCR